MRDSETPASGEPGTLHCSMTLSSTSTVHLLPRRRGRDKQRADERVSSISRSHPQRSTGAGVKDVLELRQP
jgi:hypothetical protein